MDSLYGLNTGLPYSPYAPPAAPAFAPAALARTEAPSSPLGELAGAGLQIGGQILGFVVTLLGGLMANQGGGGGSPSPAPPVDGGGGGAESHNHAQGDSAPAPVNSTNTSNLAGNSGNNVSANASGTAFPVVGYQGEVGLHHGSSHGGADLMAPRGTPVVAMRGGTVESVGSSGAGGNSVTIKGEDGLTYYYAHLDQAASVSQGQTVKTGHQIGVVGDSGNAKGTGTHLHLGIGHGIQNGTGPDGGTGSNFDATSYLKESLAAQKG